MARCAGDVAWGVTSGCIGLVISFAVALPARADTLNGALVNAYQNNPQLNSQRAVVRQSDEQVPQALSGYKPTVSATASQGEQFTSTLSKSTSQLAPGGGPTYPRTTLGFATSSVGVTASQTLFNGFQTANRVRQAESNTSAARETLRVAE